VETWLLVPGSAPDFRVVGPTEEDCFPSPARRGRPLPLAFRIGEPCPNGRRELSIFFQKTKNHDRWLSEGAAVGRGDVGGQATGVWRFPSSCAARTGGRVQTFVTRLLTGHRTDLPTAGFELMCRGHCRKFYQAALRLDHVEADFRQFPKTPSERRRRGMPFAVLCDTYRGLDGTTFRLVSVFYERGI